jgi:bacillolysin
MKNLAWIWIGVGALTAASTARSEDFKGKIYSNGHWIETNTINTEKDTKAAWLPDWFAPKKEAHPLDQAMNFLQSNSLSLNTGASAAWIEGQSQSGPEIQSLRFEKSWNGIPVVGGDAVVVIKDGEVEFANADTTPLFSVSTNPRISPDEAAATAYSSYAGRALRSETPELVILVIGENAKKEAKLTYKVTVRDENAFSSDIHFIDAETARELTVSTNVHTIVQRKVLSGLGAEEDFSLPMDQWKTVYSDQSCDSATNLGAARSNNAKLIAAGKEPSPCNDVGARAMASALSAWNNSGIVHKYYHSTHKRNSIDGKGMILNSVVNFGGEGFPNAAWYDDKGLMLYGMGDEKEFNDFALPLDVAAHEITHGITSKTSNLEYVSESGALNESYSDVLGKLVAFSTGKTSDWKLGKDLFKDGTRFIRDMENPEIDHYSKFRYKGATCSRFNDFCGVHSNSGIPNKAAVLLSKKIGLEKLGKIYYLTLTQLLRTNSTFQEAKDQSLVACGKLYGAKSSDCLAVQESFEAVGI